jgi:beta-glucosidase
LVQWLPGTEGGGVADVLFGVTPPTGRLSYAWPADVGGMELSERKTNPLYPFGYGLGYGRGNSRAVAASAAKTSADLL